MERAPLEQDRLIDAAIRCAESGAALALTMARLLRAEDRERPKGRRVP
jgi:hypothetical protein